MLAQGLRPDTRVLNECLNKARNQEEAGVILDRFSDFKHCASHDIITKNVLMKLSETFLYAEGVLASVFAEQLRPDSYTFNTMLRSAQSREDILVVVEQMKKMNIAPDRYTFGALARILDQEQICAISKDFLRAIKSKTDPVDLYFEVLSDARNLDEARIVLAQMVEAGHRVRPAHVSALASRVGSLQELVALLDQFGIDNTAVTAGAVAFAISRAGSYGDARVALSLMQEIKIAPTAAPYAAMLGHCASFDEGREFLR